MKKLPTVCCVIIEDKKKKVLLIKRGREPFKNYWSLISGVGYSKKGLSPEEGVPEEVEGDISSSPFNIKYLFKVREDNQNVEVFSANIDIDKISLNSPYINDYKWCSIDDILKFEKLAFNHQEILSKYSLRS